MTDNPMNPSSGSEDKPYTREQYDAMRKKANELGYEFITKWRKGLKNIRIGVIKSKGYDSA